MSKESFSYILGNGNPKKLLTFPETELSYISLIFQEVTFEARKMIWKNFLHFRKRNFSFFTFFRCFIFHSSGIYVFHLSWVFPFFTFLTCFLFHISRVFSFFHLVRVFLYRECYRRERAICTLRRLLPYTLFPTFDTTCFYQGFPGSQQFSLEGCRASHWGSKHRPGPSVCLNRNVQQKV